MIEWLDETCGELMSQLKKKGWLTTRWYSTSPTTAGTNTAKAHPYENGVRTPVIAHWPNQTAQGRAPTGVQHRHRPDHPHRSRCEAPGFLARHQLLNEQAVTKRDTLFLSNFFHNMVSATEPEKSLWTQSCITGKWKLIVWIKNPPKIKPGAGHRKKTGADLELLISRPIHRNQESGTSPPPKSFRISSPVSTAGGKVD